VPVEVPRRLLVEVDPRMSMRPRSHRSRRWVSARCTAELCSLTTLPSTRVRHRQQRRPRSIPVPKASCRNSPV